MLKDKNYITNARNILLMLVALFSLSPCIVKEALFSIVNIENINNAKSLNQSKTTIQSTCLYSIVEHQNSTVKQSEINKQFEPIALFNTQNFVFFTAKYNGKYPNIFYSNNPPKYILFKRLKIDIV